METAFVMKSYYSAFPFLDTNSESCTISNINLAKVSEIRYHSHLRSISRSTKLEEILVKEKTCLRIDMKDSYPIDVPIVV